MFAWYEAVRIIACCFCRLFDVTMVTVCSNSNNTLWKVLRRKLGLRPWLWLLEKELVFQKHGVKPQKLGQYHAQFVHVWGAAESDTEATWMTVVVFQLMERGWSCTWEILITYIFFMWLAELVSHVFGRYSCWLVNQIILGLTSICTVWTIQLHLGEARHQNEEEITEATMTTNNQPTISTTQT